MVTYEGSIPCHPLHWSKFIRDIANIVPQSDSLHETPFLYLTGEKAIELPSNSVIESLRRFLTFGGFLLIDSAEGSTDPLA